MRPKALLTLPTILLAQAMIIMHRKKNAYIMAHKLDRISCLLQLECLQLLGVRQQLQRRRRRVFFDALWHRGTRHLRVGLETREAC